MRGLVQSLPWIPFSFRDKYQTTFPLFPSCNIRNPEVPQLSPPSDFSVRASGLRLPNLGNRLRHGLGCGFSLASEFYFIPGCFVLLFSSLLSSSLLFSDSSVLPPSWSGAVRVLDGTECLVLLGYQQQKQQNHKSLRVGPIIIRSCEIAASSSLQPRTRRNTDQA